MFSAIIHKQDTEGVFVLDLDWIVWVLTPLGVPRVFPNVESGLSRVHKPGVYTKDTGYPRESAASSLHPGTHYGGLAMLSTV